MRRAVFAVLPLLLLGCAREAEPVMPEPGYGGADEAGTYGPSWRAPVARATAARTPAPTPVAWQGGAGGAVLPAAHPIPTAAIPDGPACLGYLQNLGVGFEALDETRGVRTPVQVDPVVGGIRYYANGDVPLVCDCRLAVVLQWIAPLLRDYGVTAARFSGAYSYRTTRSGRLSLHAHGLAIDIHELEFGNHRHSVDAHFYAGLSDGCAEAAPPLNQVACALRRTALFQELLTPDYDRDHRDHFHLGIAPLPAGQGAPSQLAAGQR